MWTEIPLQSSVSDDLKRAVEEVCKWIFIEHSSHFNSSFWGLSLWLLLQEMLSFLEESYLGIKYFTSSLKEEVETKKTEKKIYK